MNPNKYLFTLKLNKVVCWTTDNEGVHFAMPFPNSFDKDKCIGCSLYFICGMFKEEDVEKEP